MRTRLTAVLGVLLLTIVVAAGGCSDGDDDAGSGNDDQTEATDNGDDNAAADDAGDDASSDDQGSEDDAADVPEGSDPVLRQAYIDAIVDSAGTDESTGFDTEAVECLATAFVDAAGTDALSAAATPEELAETDASPAELGIDFPEGAGEVFYDHLSSCVDVRTLLVESLAGPDEAVQDCMDEALDDEMVRDYFVGVFVGGLAEDDPELLELQNRITDAIEPCEPDV